MGSHYFLALLADGSCVHGLRVVTLTSRETRNKQGGEDKCEQDSWTGLHTINENNEGSLHTGDAKLPLLLTASAAVFHTERRQTGGRHPAGEPEDTRSDGPVAGVGGTEYHQARGLTRGRAHYEVHKDIVADDVELPSGERAAIEALQRSRTAVRPAEAAIVSQNQAEILVGALDRTSDAGLYLSFEHRIVAGEALSLRGDGR